MALTDLASWMAKEWEVRRSLFGIHERLFFRPEGSDRFRTKVFGQGLATPVGVAAGPHTQMAQNIVAAWLCGARFIELKTVQTLDELEVSKPCIDMEDAGYNVEWSQELRLDESRDEYVKAWVLIHGLHKALGLGGEGPETIFNLSVGYDMAGILKPNVQGFLDAMADSGEAIAEGLEVMGRFFPAAKEAVVPSRLSDNITLSTMHGCPPGEIGTISRYLMEERGLHTYVKCNPTLLGPEPLREILNERLGYREITVPDEAFGHDIGFEDAVALIDNLRGVAAAQGVDFGVKLSNTLEVVNHRKVFAAKEKQMYMSGRPLHALTVCVADRLQERFGGELDLSFAGGADAFNVPTLLRCGMKTVTVCSDLLRSGGYTRLYQYMSELRKSGAGPVDKETARENLRSYAKSVAGDRQYHAETFDRTDTKSLRPLGAFDCIRAPCTEVCPVEQQVPAYMRAVKAGNLEEAARVVRADNTMPAILGRACHHPCHSRCVRTHLDEPVAIREIKRFIMDAAGPGGSGGTSSERLERIAVVGAGPCGLAAADFLSRAGYPVTLFDARDRAGGMVASSIPGYRASDEALERDVGFLAERGVTIRYGMRAGVHFDLDDLMQEGYAAIVLGMGAQQAGRLGMEGEEADGIWDSLGFLYRVRTGSPPELGRRVGVVGGGDVAMDCARTAWRLGAEEVSVIYRRTVKEMPAQYEERHGLVAEKIRIRELRAPMGLQAEEGRLKGMVCSVMELGEPDESGRRRPRPVPGQMEEIGLDSLIVAINQSGEFSWLEGQGIKLNEHGYIDVDERTLETSVGGVFAGGDAIGEGPATIVKALGDGKRIARAIRERFEGAVREETAVASKVLTVDRAGLQLRRALRVNPVELPERAADRRRDFDEVLLTLGVEAAKAEAGRCLDCDLLCSYCVGVCPNLALFTYEVAPVEVSVPRGRIERGRWVPEEVATRKVGQRHQVAVFADFCNECGNCVTFCPSAGRPYRDKPRLYRSRREFDGEADNAFLPYRTPEGEAGMLARYGGMTHRLDVANGVIHYETPQVEAEWTREWMPTRIQARGDAADAAGVSLERAVEMAVLLSGLAGSMPFLPLADSQEVLG